DPLRIRAAEGERRDCGPQLGDQLELLVVPVVVEARLTELGAVALRLARDPIQVAVQPGVVVAGVPGDEQVHPDGRLGQPPDLDDPLLQSLGREVPGGEQAEAARLADRRGQLRRRRAPRERREHHRMGELIEDHLSSLPGATTRQRIPRDCHGPGVLEHHFEGTPFTVGIEEELMICDAESLELAQAIEVILGDLPEGLPGEVKPELMQSVLEVATLPCGGVAEAGEQLRTLRRGVREVAARNGLAIGAAGTHPAALYEDQQIVDRPRYKELAAELGWIAEQELIFGTHVHVGVDDAEKAIYVADGMRGYLPLLLGMSTNSPLWRGRKTGMMSSRTPVFRAFPRVGIPPYYGSWEIYSHRVEQMMRGGAIPDYTYLWWDVRPHPNLGTVELRVFDQQTRIEHTIGF